MPMPATTRDAITAALKEFGPMSVAEIAEYLGRARNVVNTCMTSARRHHPGKFFRIVSYRRQVGVPGRETPIYTTGPGRDAPRPNFDTAQTRSARYQRSRGLSAVDRRRRRGLKASWLSGLTPIERRQRQQARFTQPTSPP